VARVAERAGWRGGWWRGARRVASPNHGPRPRGTAVDLLVLHSISLPPGVYGGDEVERLFTNRLDPAAHPYFEGLRGLRVSAHFFVRRDGELLQFVDCDRRAWHAGASSWRGRANCNDFSIGVELEGLEGERFEVVQYRALVRLVRGLRRRYRLAEIVGHEQVAPGRKCDPGPGFDARALGRALRRSSDCRHIAVTIGQPVRTRHPAPFVPAGRVGRRLPPSTARRR
jgi:AmpD protein